MLKKGPHIVQNEEISIIWTKPFEYQFPYIMFDAYASDTVS